MSKNEFLPFGTAANANVLSNAEYQALSARGTGFASGVAKSKELNTAWRQASVIASVVAQFIADNSGKDVLDNGDLFGLQENLNDALLKNLKLGSAANKNIGALNDEVPDMSYFKNGSGYQSFPGGMTMQWGQTYTSASPGSPVRVNLPVPFKKTVSSVVATRTSDTVSDTINSIAVSVSSLSYFDVRSKEASSTISWVAIGY